MQNGRFWGRGVKNPLLSVGHSNPYAVIPNLVRKGYGLQPVYTFASLIQRLTSAARAALRIQPVHLSTCQPPTLSFSPHLLLSLAFVQRQRFADHFPPIPYHWIRRNEHANRPGAVT